ncbi:HAMP domain-containing histidine kinase [Pseudanabaena sp. FACHB-1998]|uniref:ATP-binding protein n=1 Tax=Pseudanabaena sp. FACHB-1998 TaxID=2692858 RepID=UPI001681B036|nr:ATP-binding protein [Pseudanabaena sp. FACHB-1998]MBD2177157.1 HAMP domain-containing histidine kinase [Pseudanabaena sp. FACHB-1998]
MSDLNNIPTINCEYVNTITNPVFSHRNDSDILNNTEKTSIKFKETKDTFMVDEVIADSIARLTKITLPKDIQVVFEMNSEAIVYARKDMVCCMIRNLIINIVKFGNIGETVKIFSKTVDDHIVVSIIISGDSTNNQSCYQILQTDTYITHDSKIDEIIARIELLLCRQFAEENNSNLSVVFNNEKDTVFTFSLPKSKHDLFKGKIKFSLPLDSVIHWHSGY